MPLLFERQSGPTVFFAGDSSYLHSVRLADGRLLVTAFRGSANGITGNYYDSTGASAGTPFTIANHAPASSIVALAGGGFALTWSAVISDHEIYLEFYTSAGVQVGSTIHVNTLTRFQQYDSQVAVLPSGRFVVTWTDESALGGDSDRAVAV